MGLPNAERIPKVILPVSDLMSYLALQACVNPEVEAKEDRAA